MKASPFHRQVERDFLTTFLCAGEFGKVCEWNGGKLRIAEAAMDNVVSEDGMGLFHNNKKVYCRSADLPGLPKPTDVITINRVRWRVVDSRELLGHFEILLERFTGA